MNFVRFQPSKVSDFWVTNILWPLRALWTLVHLSTTLALRFGLDSRSICQCLVQALFIHGILCVDLCEPLPNLSTSFSLVCFMSNGRFESLSASSDTSVYDIQRLAPASITLDNDAPYSHLVPTTIPSYYHCTNASESDTKTRSVSAAGPSAGESLQKEARLVFKPQPLLVPTSTVRPRPPVVFKGKRHHPDHPPPAALVWKEATRLEKLARRLENDEICDGLGLPPTPTPTSTIDGGAIDCDDDNDCYGDDNDWYYGDDNACYGDGEAKVITASSPPEQHPEDGETVEPDGEPSESESSEDHVEEF